MYYVSATIKTSYGVCRQNRFLPSDNVTVIKFKECHIANQHDEYININSPVPP